MNNKGEEKLFSIWHALVIVIVTLFYVGGVYLYYNSDSDVREAHSEILLNRLIRCIIEGNKVNDAFLAEEANILEVCKLNRIDFENGNLYFRITMKNKNYLINKFESAGENYKTECELYFSGIKGNDIPRCSNVSLKGVYHNSGEEKIADIVIVSGAKTQGGRR